VSSPEITPEVTPPSKSARLRLIKEVAENRRRGFVCLDEIDSDGQDEILEVVCGRNREGLQDSR